jgi:hypothetical protein
MSAAIQFNLDEIEWTHLEGTPEDGYPIDYWIAVLGYEEKNGTLDLLVKWAPNAYCHFHRHVAATTTLVLEGEQHIIETDDEGKETHKVRPKGTYVHSSGGDVHMEHGGPNGAVVFFAMQNPSGLLFELLDRDGNVIGESTIAGFAEQIGELDQHAAG